MNKYQTKKIKGASMIEYAAIAGIVSVGAVSVLATLTNYVGDVYSYVKTELDGLNA